MQPQHLTVLTDDARKDSPRNSFSLETFMDAINKCDESITQSDSSFSSDYDISDTSQLDVSFDSKMDMLSDSPQKSSYIKPFSPMKPKRLECPPTPKRIRRTIRNAVLERAETLINFCEQDTEYRYSSFTFKEEIGDGYFGKIWKVTLNSTGECYAIKESKSILSTLRERDIHVTALSNLKQLFVGPGEWHQHILTHYSVWQESKFFYVQTELCEQSDISKYFARKARIGEISESDIWDFIDQIAPTLKFMHERGVLHMDIKPENIYVTKSGCFKIGDWGLSVAKERWSDDFEEGDSDYLAPEVLRDGKIGPTSDIYSFGMSLHRLISGECVPTSEISDPSKRLRKTLFPISAELRKLVLGLIDYNSCSRISLDDVITIASQKKKKAIS